MLRSIVCCLVMVGLLIPAVVACGELTVASERGTGHVSEFGLAAVSGGSDGIGWLVGFFLGYMAGKAIDWYLEFQEQPGYYDPPDPPGSWWPGRI
jgi:hypothetical protein